MRKLTMLGTGNAMVTKCYNTCFYVTLENGALFLTDAGGARRHLGHAQGRGPHEQGQV